MPRKPPTPKPKPPKDEPDNSIPTDMPSPSCRLGYTIQDLDAIFQNDTETMTRFGTWMFGQTFALCEARVYNPETEEYEEACGGVAHGNVYYPYDVKRFLNGLPILD